MACRRRAASDSASTGSPWFSRAATTSATSSSFPLCGNGLRSSRRGAPDGLDHVGEDVVERACGRPIDRRTDLLDRRLAVERVLDAESVDLVVGDEAQLRPGAGELADPLRQLDDRHALGGADVEHGAGKLGALHQAAQRPDRVGDVAERPGLRTVAVPWTFVTIVWTGCSTIRRTPTAAARW